MQALSGHNIITGFHRCDVQGIVYPFNPNAIEILDDNTANKSGIDLNYSHDYGTPMSEDLHYADVNSTQLSHQMNEHKQSASPS